MQPIIIIPAYQPDNTLLLLLEQLVEQTENKIIVIDDGSDSACNAIFNRADKYSAVHILTHKENRGKGAALRTGFRYILAKESSCSTVISADADGQHRAEDISRVSKACTEHPHHLILGVRQFTGYVPLRSRLGNSLTRRLYNLLFRQNLRDTQTGLRGIPVHTLTTLIALQGERYCYELEMLLKLMQLEGPVLEIGISTIYEKNNESSHFRPFHDSAQIYTTLFRWWFKHH